MPRSLDDQLRDHDVHDGVGAARRTCGPPRGRAPSGRGTEPRRCRGGSAGSRRTIVPRSPRSPRRPAGSGSPVSRRLPATSRTGPLGSRPRSPRTRARSSPPRCGISPRSSTPRVAPSVTCTGTSVIATPGSRSSRSFRRNRSHRRSRCVTRRPRTSSGITIVVTSPGARSAERSRSFTIWTRPLPPPGLERDRVAGERPPAFLQVVGSAPVEDRVERDHLRAAHRAHVPERLGRRRVQVVHDEEHAVAPGPGRHPVEAPRAPRRPLVPPVDHQEHRNERRHRSGSRARRRPAPWR